MVNSLSSGHTNPGSLEKYILLCGPPLGFHADAMNYRSITAVLAVLAGSGLPLHSNELVKAADGSGTYGYESTPVLPWCGYHVHDPNRPAPQRVDPGPPGAPIPAPSDALVLFDGTDLSRWTGDWAVEDGCIVAGGGTLATKEEFGDLQIHLEWMTPENFDGPWYNQGNNGIKIMGLYEIQIFDSFTEKIYPDGQAAAIYAQTPPLVNVTRRPGEWQSFDIIFTAPRFEDDKLVSPPRVTMFHNGVLVHLNEVVHGATRHLVLPDTSMTKSIGPLVLAGHDCPVRFRNIWVRKL